MANKINFHYKNPEEDSGYLLWQTTMLWQRQMNRALDEIHLTHTQFVIMIALGWLLKSSKSVTQKEIAVQSSTDSMMVSKILRTLQKNELVERKEHETDTRAKCVSLTKKGIYKLQQAIEIINRVNDSYFGKLSNESKFRDELKKMIK
ncbi:MAG: MarR family transcriptional regulator [Maribacter sp.]|nr:MarR family transcriptional regulator [Maribacter sp.]MBT8315265.1 MarR family transcriptional regulator [Maribacter sp.]